MKIGILIEKLLPGSIPKIISSEVNYLKSQGHEVEVLAIMQGGLPPDSYRFGEFLKDITIREISRESRLARCCSFKLPFFSFLSAYHLAGPLYVSGILKKQEYDVIIGFNPTTCLTAYGIWRRRHIPYIDYHWDPLSYLFDKVYAQKLPRFIAAPLGKAAASVDKIVVNGSLAAIALSEEHAAQLRDLKPRRKIEIVYMGCFPAVNLPEKRGDYLLAIDRWDRGNMPHMLLEVISRLKTKTSLRVAGFCSEDWIRNSFLKTRDEKGLTEQVSWLGPVSEEELNQLYLGARAWLHPIEESSVSMPALEAAAHGCPVIMPKGTPLFTHGIEGFFPAEGSLDQYADYVTQFIEDERLAWEMGRKGWEMAKQHDWQAHSRQIGEMIEKYVK